MAAIGVTWGAVSREVLEAADPDAVVDTVEELRRVVGLPASVSV
jgi:phosphoglycolate phosphatase-like HAD superfamily hydrolase